MPVDSDFTREERIKRLRSLVKSGMDQMLVLHDAVPAYLRLGDLAIQRPTPRLENAQGIAAGLTESVKREHAISMGFNFAERQHRLYTKIYKWLAGADNGSPRNLGDDLFSLYRELPSAHLALIDTRADATVEAQILQLSEAIESRIAVFVAQLELDGEHEDIAPGLRDSPGGWPHLRQEGLLTDAVLDGYLARMRRRRTRSEISDSIGGAKEVTEATMKALAVKHGALPASATPDLGDYWKVLRPHLVDSSIDRALGAKDGSVMKLVSSQVSTIMSLGELRNRVGTGHGRTDHPAGLQPAHALLAVDVAHSTTRFLTS